MEEEKVIKTLNFYYYGMMVLALVILGVMYYLTSRPDAGFLDPNGETGMILQYTAILFTLLGIPAALYAVKYKKPDTLEKYKNVAAFRILLVGYILSMDIAMYYLLGMYKPMMWLAAMSAVAWYFTKPTLGKMEQEMKPKDPNTEDY